MPFGLRESMELHCWFHAILDSGPRCGQNYVTTGQLDSPRRRKRIEVREYTGAHAGAYSTAGTSFKAANPRDAAAPDVRVSGRCLLLACDTGNIRSVDRSVSCTLYRAGDFHNIADRRACACPIGICHGPTT